MLSYKSGFQKWLLDYCHLKSVILRMVAHFLERKITALWNYTTDRGMDGELILNALWIGWAVIKAGRLLTLRNSGKSSIDQSLGTSKPINRGNPQGPSDERKLMQGCHSEPQALIPTFLHEENIKMNIVSSLPDLTTGPDTRVLPVLTNEAYTLCPHFYLLEGSEQGTV